eukprot:COSAG04_NODE_2193_length_4561_cov_46.389960_1_plen_117_part_00
MSGARSFVSAAASREALRASSRHSRVPRRCRCAVTVLRLRARPHPLLDRLGGLVVVAMAQALGAGQYRNRLGNVVYGALVDGEEGGVAAVAPAAPGAAAVVRVWCSRITTMHIFIH